MKVNIFVSIILAIVSLFMGCNTTGIHYTQGRTDIIIPSEEIITMPSINKAAVYLAKEIKSKWKNYLDKEEISKKDNDISMLVGYFTNISDNSRNMLCQKFEQYLKNELNCKQSIDEANLLKLRKYWGVIESQEFDSKYAYSGLLEDAHCLVTGTFELQEFKKIIYVFIDAHDTKTGIKVLSTRVALNFDDPDIKGSWNKKIEIQNYIQPTQSVNPVKHVKPVNMTKDNMINPIPPKLDYNLSFSSIGKGNTKYMAYIAGQTLVDESFVREYVPRELVSYLKISDKNAIKIVEENLHGWVPPGIKYTPEDEIDFKRDDEDKNLWKGKVTGYIDKSRFSYWIRKKADQYKKFQ